jgi:hypothetical protein
MLIPSRRQLQDLPKSALAAFGAIAIGAALGCTVDKLSAEPVRGVQHVLYLAVGSNPGSQQGQREGDGEVKSRLTVSVRISAHSQETNFFGVVHANIPEFDLAKGSKFLEIWRDQRCHHERGFPKITVTNIDGLVKSGQWTDPVAARTRILGLLLPSDEVLASRRVGDGADNLGPYIETQTETKKSRLSVDLKLYILRCDLPPGLMR